MENLDLFFSHKYLNPWYSPWGKEIKAQKTHLWIEIWGHKVRYCLWGFLSFPWGRKPSCLCVLWNLISKWGPISWFCFALFEVRLFLHCFHIVCLVGLLFSHSFCIRLFYILHVLLRCYVNCSSECFSNRKTIYVSYLQYATC